jgi:glycosyltransferase involved in cell wall biosynthesis
MNSRPVIRLLAIVPQIPDVSPGQRFRLEQWEPLLREFGVETRFEAFESPELNALIYQPGGTLEKISLIVKAFNRRFSLLSSIKEFDVVYIFREAALLGPAIIERRIARLGIPIVFDFDDAIFIPYISPSNGLLSLLKFPWKTRAICRLSTHIMAGNQYLAEYAARVNKNVAIVPTTIDLDKYTLEVPTATPDRLTIGWTGSYSTVQHLDTLRAVLQRLGKGENFRLRVIGTANYKIEGVDAEALPWNSSSEIADLRSVDIGIMPLPDNRWTKGKCGLKALQYMALGIPVVCSPVGVNSEIIQDEKNGFLASTEEEWVERLTRLLHSADLRSRVGLAGRATVESKYCARAQAPRVYDILRSAVRK